MKLKRIFSVALAVLITAFSLPLEGFSYVLPKIPPLPRIQFIKPHQPNIATVVAGTNVGVTLPSNNDYSLGTPPFKISTGADDVTNSNLITYVPHLQDPDTGISKNPFFKTSKGASGATDKILSAETQYNINANYSARKIAGKAAEHYVEDGKEFDPTIEIYAECDSAILTTSSIKLEAMEDEVINADKSRIINFRIVGTPTGVFAGMKESVSGKRNEKDPMCVWFAEKEIKLYLLTNQTKDFIKDPDDPDSKETKSFIRKDTTYNVSFTTAVSDPMILNVLSPKRAAEKLSDHINNKKEDFVILTRPDKNVQRITKEFYLLNKVNFYGSECRLSWEWESIPDTTIGQTQEQTDEVVKFVEDSIKKDRTHANVVPIETDVHGILTVKIKCYVNGQFSENDEVELKIPIMIFGLGRDPYVELRDQKIGKDPYVTLKPKDCTDVEWNMKPIYAPKEMDLNEGDVEVEGIDIAGPHSFRSTIHLGGGNAASQRVVIESSDPEAVEILINKDTYSFGSDIENPDLNEDSLINIEIRAKTAGKNTRLTFKFYRKNLDTKKEENHKKWIIANIHVNDTRPSKDCTLKSLTLKTGIDPDPTKNYEPNPKPHYNEVIDYGEFKPNKTDYATDVPFNATETVQLIPFINDKYANQKMNVSIRYPNKEHADILSSEHLNNTPIVIALPKENTEAKVKIEITAQDPNYKMSYYFTVRRNTRNSNSLLKILTVYNQKDVLHIEDYVQNFDPNTKEYRFTVPYKVRKIRISAETQYIDGRAKLDSPDPVKGTDSEGAVPVPIDTNELDLKRYPELIKLTHPEDIRSGYNDLSATTEVVIKSLSEKAAYPSVGDKDSPISEYKLYITRNDPSDEARLNKLEIEDRLGKPLKTDVAFDSDTFIYNVFMPYSMDKIKFMAEPKDQNASMQYQFVNMSEEAVEADWKEINSNVFVLSDQIPYTAEGKKFQTLLIKVTAENEKEADAKTYKVQITREKPNDESMLESLKVSDQNKAEVSYDFFSDIYTYTIEVPYETTHAVLTPKAVFDDVGKITINYSDEERQLDNGNDSISYKLKDYPSVSEFKVTVIAQDMVKTSTYTIKIKRLAPSSDCLLKNLTLGETGTMEPIFVPSKRNYKAEVAKDKREIMVTATAHHKKAIIKINGKTAESGKPFGPIEALEVRSKVNIEVIAQNGKTKRIYTIDVKNPNLINLSSNADLEFLEVKNGVMDPPFSPSISTYNLVVKDDTAHVDICAEPADYLAQMTMFSDTREVGDEQGNLSEYVGEGQTNFTIEVVSPDNSKTKDYVLNVFRKDEENQGTLKPVSTDQVDFKAPGNVVVDITKYSIVSSDIFKKFQKDCKDKTLTFVGNDYSLQFKGSDLGKVNIPFETVYDFSLSFSSPEEEEIREVMGKWEKNDRVIPITIYFGHHGTLPAPAKLNVSLGERYKNVWMGWHHYNTQRDRIDYLGKFATNYRGNFSVTLTHMSTYLISPFKIVGSENKAVSDGVLSTPKRINPATGENR